MPAISVHVSDIHFGQERDHVVHIHDDVKRELVADAAAVVAELPACDVKGRGCDVALRLRERQ